VHRTDGTGLTADGARTDQAGLRLLWQPDFECPTWHNFYPREAPEGVNLVTRAGGFGPSDHAPFYASGIPVLHFFTGSHADYHTPNDTVERLNIHGALAVLETVRRVIEAVNVHRVLSYVPPSEQLLLYVGRSGSYGGAYLGAVPAFAEPVTGVRVARVEAGSPLDGIVAPGDVLVDDGPLVEVRAPGSYRLLFLRFFPAQLPNQFLWAMACHFLA
jgi:hypothetical protein